MKMRNRVYGVLGIRSIMSNWNADMTGNPKTVLSGEIFGSDKALKFPIKKMWETNGEKVLYLKSYKISDDKKADAKMQPRDLNERYEELFDKINEKTPSCEVLKNLFSAVDVMNFGATFAEKKQNISITGAVQIGQGYNKYENSEIQVIDILSPFRNSNEKSEGNQASSMGTKVVTDEAHYFYPFSVNPLNYSTYLTLGIEGFEGYTEEAFNKFKEGCKYAATAYNTNSKSGCENEFALFISCKEGSKLYLANLDRYIEFKKVDEGYSIDISKIAKVIEKYKDQIDDIEVYYNNLDTTIETGGLKCELIGLY